MHSTGEHDVSSSRRRAPPSADRTREETIVDLGRTALRTFIEKVLFNPAHPASEIFRERAMVWKPTPGSKLKASLLEEGTSLRKRLLAAVATWRPQKGWEKFDFLNGQTFLSGDLSDYGPFHLVMEQGRVVSVTLELDNGVLLSEKTSRMV